MGNTGVYIVTLTNEAPISVNAHDRRRASTTIKVTRANCEIGKATDLTRRAENYRKTFGAPNVQFRVVAFTDAPVEAEREILKRLRSSRVRGKNGRLNEWLFGIEPANAMAEALEALRQSGIAFTVPQEADHAV